MKQKILTYLLLFVFLTINLTANAQKKSITGIGKVDMYVLLLLHPDMINYNTEKQAFEIKRNDASKKKAEKEQKVNSEEIEKINYLMKELKDKMVEEDKKYMKKSDELRKSYMNELVELATGPAAVRTITYRHVLEEADAVHFSIMNSYVGEYASLEEKLFKLKKYGFNEGFTTPEETNKRFETIMNETTDYIKKIAKKRGVEVVLNSGYKRIMRKSLNLPNDNWLIPIDRSLGGIFKPSFPQELSNDELGIKGYYESLNNKTRFWLDNASPLLERMKSNLVNSDIILGGTDLTEEVLNFNSLS